MPWRKTWLTLNADQWGTTSYFSESRKWLTITSHQSVQQSMHLFAGGTQTASGEPLDASGDTPHAAMGSATYDRSRAEDCVSKVLQFCREHLQITDPESVIQIDRAHRIGRYQRNKVRPIVAKFKDTQSIMCIKNALRRVDLRRTPYNVTEQYPAEVLERRKSLVGHMMQARRDGKRAVLVRDKLFIDGRPFVPTSTPPRIRIPMKSMNWAFALGLLMGSTLFKRCRFCYFC